VRKRRYGFTTRASCLLAAGVTAIVCGVALGEVDLVRAGVLAVAIPVVAALVVHRSRLRIANRRSLEPQHVSAGQSVTVHLTITNRSVLPTGALMLEDQLPERMPGRARFVLDSLSGHESRTVSYRLPALGRGRYRAGPLRVRLTDPFKMLDLTRSFTATNDFVVTPVIDELPAVEPPRSDELGSGSGSSSIGAHGADDASTREYRIGDDLRKIHWRSSARTGALMVRQEERPWRTQTTVLLDLRANAHELDLADHGDSGQTEPRLTSSLEWAISAAASIATLALRTGREVGIVGEPGAGDRAHRFGDATAVARHLALVRAQKHYGLATLATPLRAAARDSALVAVLGRLSPDDLRLLADAQPRARSAPALALLLDVDSWAGPPPVDSVSDVGGDPGGDMDSGTEFPFGNVQSGEPVSDPGSSVHASAALLRSAGWRVAVVRRGTTTAQAWRLLLPGAPVASGEPVLGVTAVRQ
jgi:uncharacterized protein (DUF58 family)